MVTDVFAGSEYDSAGVNIVGLEAVVEVVDCKTLARAVL